MELFSKATEQLKGTVGYRHSYIDFSKLEVSLPKVGGGTEVVKTCPAALGFAFAAGTTDGPGAFDFKQGDDQVSEKLLVIFFSIYKKNSWMVNLKYLGNYNLDVSFRGIPFGSW